MLNLYSLTDMEVIGYYIIHIHNVKQLYALASSVTDIERSILLYFENSLSLGLVMPRKSLDILSPDTQLIYIPTNAKDVNTMLDDRPKTQVETAKMQAALTVEVTAQ